MNDHDAPVKEPKKRIAKNRIDITGQQFGELTAIRRTTYDRWIFLCSCGKEVEFPASRVMYGTQKSCGHLAKNAVGVQGIKIAQRKDGIAYCAYIKWRNENIQLGIYVTLAEAIAARKAAERMRDVMKKQKSEIEAKNAESVIAEKRIKAGLSRSKLGELVGVDRQTVGDWERRKSFPRSAETIKKLESALHCKFHAPKREKVLAGDQNPIFQRRKAMGLSRRTVGEKLGVTSGAVYRWEKNGVIPRRETLEKLALLLMCHPDDLIPTE